MRTPVTRAVVALFLCLTAAGAAGQTMTDAAGRSVRISDTSRIVSIGGAVTEILYALGLEDRVLAVDLTSTYPARAAAKPSVGYMRALSPEGVLSVGPSVILAIEGSGPADAIEVLEKASVPFVLVPEGNDAAGVARKVRFIAGIVGAKAHGEEIARAIEQDFATLAKMPGDIAKRRRAIFVLSMAGGAPMVAGRGTAADGVFALAAVDNALTGFNGYKRANEEAALAAEPDAIVIMAERGHAMTPDAVFAVPAFSGTPAARDRRLVALPGSYLLGFGPRAAHAARDLAAGVYPDLKLPPLPPRPWNETAAE